MPCDAALDEVCANLRILAAVRTDPIVAVLRVTLAKALALTASQDVMTIALLRPASAKS